LADCQNSEAIKSRTTAININPAVIPTLANILDPLLNGVGQIPLIEINCGHVLATCADAVIADTNFEQLIADAIPDRTAEVALGSKDYSIGRRISELLDDPFSKSAP
jgi:hypothetical protein